MIKTDYSVKEILQENVNDLDIMREKPVTFKAGGEFLVCRPVKYYEHPKFLRDLGTLLLTYKEIFAKIEWLSIEGFKEDPELTKAVAQITIFNTSAEYESFCMKGLPWFITEWCYTIKKDKLIKLKKRKAKRILENFTVEDMFKVMMTLYVFNYDIVKKNMFNLLGNLTGEKPKTNTGHSTSYKKKKDVQMPKFSEKPFSKSVLRTLEEQSTMS